MRRSILQSLMLLLVFTGGGAMHNALNPVAQAKGVRPHEVKGAAPQGRGPDIGQIGESQILEAYGDRRSDLIVEASGTIKRLLEDDLEGSRHQRFILELPSGHTLLISHNIDIAPRIDALREGAEIRFRGEYEWNEQGGIVHWTHHNPNGGDHPGGWILYNETYYQ